MPRSFHSTPPAGRGRLLVGVCSLVVFGLVGCLVPHDSTTLGLVAVNVSTGEPIEGVRILHHIETPDGSNASFDAVAITDPAGTALLDAPRPDARWLVVRDGYDPMMVWMQEGDEAVDPGPFGTVVRWTDLARTGVLDLPLTPTTWKSVRLTVIDADTGAGVPDARVSVESVSYFDRQFDRHLLGVPVVRTGTTDPHGVATLEVPSGTTSKVTVEAAGWAKVTTTLDPDSPTGISSRRMISMQAYRYQPTRVLVLDRNTGLPVEGAVLRVSRADPASGETVGQSIWITGMDGSAVVMKPSAGLGSIRIEHENRLPGEFRMVEIHAPEFDAIAIGLDEPDIR